MGLFSGFAPDESLDKLTLREMKDKYEEMRIKSLYMDGLTIDDKDKMLTIKSRIYYHENMEMEDKPSPIHNVLHFVFGKMKKK